MLQELLQPVGIEVRSEVQVMALPPRADILLIRRLGSDWTAQQRLLLADGLRDLVADHILAEMKLRGGLFEDGLIQILLYDHMLLTNDKTLTRDRLQSVIISAQTPQGDLLVRFGFKPTGIAGVYQCEASPWCGKIRVILLNELADTPHNAPLKCFASHRRERDKAFATIRRLEIFKHSIGFGRLIAGLWRLLMKESMGHPELEGMTPEHVMALGQEWFEFLLESTPDEELSVLPKMALFQSKSRLEGKREGEAIGEARGKAIGEARGKAIGEARGKAIGEARGKAIGKANTLLRLLTKRFGPRLPDWVSSKVLAADERSLELWIDRILDAVTLEDIFQS
jgi:hypothetical protein